MATVITLRLYSATSLVANRNMTDTRKCTSVRDARETGKVEV